MIFQCHIARITQSAAAWTCRAYPFFKWRNFGLSAIQSVRYWNKGTQSGTGMLQNRTEIWCRNADAGGIVFDADAQLWYMKIARRVCTWGKGFCSPAALKQRPVRRWDWAAFPHRRPGPRRTAPPLLFRRRRTPPRRVCSRSPRRLDPGRRAVY